MQSYDDDDDEFMDRLEHKEVNPSPSLLQPPSGRKGSKKVRSGCITCKIRKVKCDEAKPYCTRCTKTGRKCDGYLDASALAIRRRRRRRSTNPETSLDEGSPSTSQPYSASKLQLDTDQQYIASLSASAKRGKHGKQASTPSSRARTPLPQSVDMLSWATSAQEKRAFDFFQTITAPCLAGDLDAVFWRVLVLQVCHTEPAVRHAVLAISSLHELFLRPKAEAPSSKITKKTSPPPSSDTSIVQEFALQQYNKAIAHMLEDMKGDKTSSDDEREYDEESDGDYQNQHNQNHYEDGNQHRNPKQNATVLHRPVAPLMTCILFLCIEVMQGKDKEALIHLEQGRHILSQLDDNRQPNGSEGKEGRGGKILKPKKSRRAPTGSGGNSAEMAVVRQHLVPLYTRLSMTSFLFGGSPLSIPPSLKSPSLSPSEAAPETATVPDTFDTIHGLRASVHDFLDTVLRFTRKARSSKYPKRAASPSTTPSANPAPASTSTSASAYHTVSPTSAPVSLRASLCTLELEKRTMLAQLRRLRIAHSLFHINQSPVPAFPLEVKSTPTNFNSNAATLALLQIHLSIAEIWLATALTRDEVAFDAHVETFSSVVSLAVTVLDIERQQQSLSAQNSMQNTSQTSQTLSKYSVFTLETHIIPALYFVATKCRHGPVRHAALAMLSANAGRRENLWRADVLGAIAARIVQIEEGVDSGKGETENRDKVENEDKKDDGDTKSVMSHETSPTPTPTDNLHAISDPWFATSLNINNDLPGLYSPHHVQDWPRASVQAENSVFPSNTTRTGSSGGGDSTSDTRSGHRPPWHSSGGSIDGNFLDNDVFYFGDTSTTITSNVPSMPPVDEVNNEAAAALPALFLSPPTPTACGLSITPAMPTATKIWPRAVLVCSTSDLQSPSSIPVSSPAVSSFDTESPVSPGGICGHFNMGDNPGGPSTDTPFGVPEHARVHVAVIGAEEPKGRWVTLFRKPNGLHGAWDVRSEFVSIDSL